MRPLLAAANGESDVAKAGHVCANCKARKKKCDKALPSCRNCVRKHLSCNYDYAIPTGDAVTSSRPGDHSASGPATPQQISSELTLSKGTGLHGGVLLSIRAMGRFVDDVSVSYFQGLHQHLPMVSRTRFHDSLLTAPTAPSPGLSALLLVMCLVTSRPDPEQLQPGSALRAAASGSPSPATQLDRRTLYLTARSTLWSVQAVCNPSIELIQAGILLALYDYINGDSDKAFAFLAGYARLAPAAGIKPRAISAASEDGDGTSSLQEAEEANTWWALVICERIFSCDTTGSEQPFLTLFPDNDVQLPTEPGMLEQNNVMRITAGRPVSALSLTAVDIGWFGRSAQAAWLLDRVLKSFRVSDWDCRLSQLYTLDDELQAFLRMLMQPGYSGRRPVCKTIAMAIRSVTAAVLCRPQSTSHLRSYPEDPSVLMTTYRALFTLHCHIVDQSAQTIAGAGECARECQNRSLATLDTVSRMVLDIVETNNNMEQFALDQIAPSYPYIVQASISHLSRRVKEKDEDWSSTARDKLRLALDQFVRRKDGKSSRTG